MLPYLEPFEIRLGALALGPVPILFSAGIIAGVFLFRARARFAGLSASLAGEITMFGVFGGLLAAQTVSLLVSGRGTGVFALGVLLGGITGAGLFLIYSRVPPIDQWRYIDAGVFVFPFAWFFPRLACSLVHDHPGIHSSNWLAVRYPEGPRFDLGVLELLFSTLLAALFLVLDRRRRSEGFYLGLFLCAFGSFRIWADSLRVDPGRWQGWTLDQMAGTAAILAGTTTLIFLLRNPARRL